ncbi:MAG: ABC transporter ATP-binding protein [candidate division WOR-3 bacterium]
MSAIIKVEDLHKKYGDREILQGINFTVQRGECFCLLGPNGAGKTTTLKILTGFLQPNLGNVFVLGIDVLQKSKALKGLINIIPQTPSLDPFLTIDENLIFYGMLQKIKSRELRERVDEVLKIFEIENIKNQLALHCSGGEQQRLMIARAFLKTSEIIFMDEPTSGIDILLKNKLWNYFKERKKEGVTIFLNTHDLNEAEIMSDRIAFIFDGKIVAIDTPAHLKSMIKEVKINIMLENLVINDTIFDHLKSSGISVVFKKDENRIELTSKEINGEVISVINLLALKYKIKFLEIQQPSLNDVFNKLGVRNVGDNMA